MPSVRLTPEQREEHANNLICEKVRNMLRSEMALCGVRDVKELADALKVSANSLRRKFSGDTKWDVYTLSLCCDYLRISEAKRADLLSGRVRRS